MLMVGIWDTQTRSLLVAQSLWCAVKLCIVLSFGHKPALNSAGCRASCGIGSACCELQQFDVRGAGVEQHVEFISIERLCCSMVGSWGLSLIFSCK